MYEEIKTAALYARYSSQNQTEQSIEGQIRVCKEFADKYKIQIVGIYADRATSASKDLEKRTEFLRMIRESEKHSFDAVIVYKLDRFSRTRYDMATFKYRLKKNGVQLISATENISTNPEGIILESVLEGMAEYYSAELSQKINRGLRESAYKHNVVGGHVPLGYKLVNKKMVIDETTAPIVQEAFLRYANGERVAAICRDFNARGLRTSKNTKFGKSSFVKMFRNERYIGVYQYKDYRAEDAVPRIISNEVWEKVQLRNKEQKLSAPYSTKHIYALTGKLFCGHCGNKMHGNSNSQGYVYYECWGKKNLSNECTKKNLRRDFIENIVANDAYQLLTDENIEMIAEKAVDLNNQDIQSVTNIPSIKTRLDEINKTLDNLTKAIETGQVPETLVKRMVELEQERRELQTALRNEEKDVIYLDKYHVMYWLEQFKNGDIQDPEYRKLIIDLFVNSVTVWDEPDDSFRITIAYNLTDMKSKTYNIGQKTTVGFDFKTGGLKTKSDVFLIHTIFDFYESALYRKNGHHHATFFKRICQSQS